MAHGVRLHELEGLVRGPSGTHVESAEVLFEYVRRKGKEIAVDRACVEAILKSAWQLPGSPRIGINVTASTLGNDPQFPSFLRVAADFHQVSLDRITIEIVEHTPFWDGGTFLGALDKLRDYGVRIALDDIGVGQSNYRMILDCHPHCFKVDKYIVQGCSTDPQRRAVLSSIVRLARGFSAHVVAEGVEEIADFEAATAAGVDLIQGYLFAYPMTPELLRESGLLNASTPLKIPVDGYTGVMPNHTVVQKPSGIAEPVVR
jgi:EAL domain-containing protein (putative c-di-GMP-specific phosphodiesterase class I)